MKKLMLSCIVMILTLLSVIAMLTFKTRDIVEASKTHDEIFQNESMPEGTGLIFDDTDQNINIKYNPVQKNDIIKENKESHK